ASGFSQFVTLLKLNKELSAWVVALLPLLITVPVMWFRKSKRISVVSIHRSWHYVTWGDMEKIRKETPQEENLRITIKNILALGHSLFYIFQDARVPAKGLVLDKAQQYLLQTLRVTYGNDPQVMWKFLWQDFLKKEKERLRGIKGLHSIRKWQEKSLERRARKRLFENPFSPGQLSHFSYIVRWLISRSEVNWDEEENRPYTIDELDEMINEADIFSMPDHLRNSGFFAPVFISPALSRLERGINRSIEDEIFTP
ncbi:MAG TPA: hypothetical protein VJA17_02185, partial [Candidatus Omnitrophota bacterium]|nr:hypothetical protein [Candidatus Omnitrophota bacterium]